MFYGVNIEDVTICDMQDGQHYVTKNKQGCYMERHQSKKCFFIFDKKKIILKLIHVISIKIIKVKKTKIIYLSENSKIKCKIN